MNARLQTKIGLHEYLGIRSGFLGAWSRTDSLYGLPVLTYRSLDAEFCSASIQTFRQWYAELLPIDLTPSMLRGSN